MNFLRLLFSAVACLLIPVAPEAQAQSIPNPGFEAQSFTVWPGYVSNNGAITGWTSTSLAGLNPAAGSPFADNGAIPQGNNAAFIQSSGTLSTLATTISGLTPGKAYLVRFRANCRSGYPPPVATWSLNGGADVPFTAAPAVGGLNGYYSISGLFIATSDTAALAIHNQTATDTTLLVDDFSIAPAVPSGWAVSPWTGDATSGLSPQALWAWRFGSATNTTINGATVSGVEGPDADVPEMFTVRGIPNVFTDDENNLTPVRNSGSAELAKNFIWGGDPATITLTGLTPGLTYVASLFSVGWDATDHRILTFSSGGQESVVDQDLFGNDNGLRVDYTFVADADTRVITVSPKDPGFTFHLYGLALRQPIMVSNNADSGAGSLRQALATAAAQPGPDFIAFEQALSGQSITLGSAINVPNDTKGIVIDATTLPGGLTLGNSGGHSTIIFGSSFPPTVTDVTLRGLTFVNGGGPGFPGAGGAIYNQTNCLLTMTRCTVSGSFSSDGGGIINNEGTVTLTDCILSGNSTPGRGGAIFNDGNMTLTRCTLSGNSAQGGQGGAIYHFYGVLTLDQCTLSENSSVAVGSNGGIGGAICVSTINGAGGIENLTHCTVSNNFATKTGGGIFVGNNLGSLNVTDSIIGANTAPSGGDIQFRGNLVRTGANVIQSVVNEGTGSNSGPAAITSDPLLAPLANYGGPAPTMALRPGSPARNAASGPAIASDQRGFSIIGAPDIGAYEAGTLNNCAATLAETFPATVPAALVGPAGDFDGDGCANEQEWNALTDPANPASFFRILSAVRSGANLVLTFPTVTGRNYTLRRSDSLTGTWTDTGLPPLSGNDSNRTFTIPAPVAGTAKRFYRVEARP
jgi:hypothetical protein